MRLNQNEKVCNVKRYRRNERYERNLEKRTSTGKASKEWTSMLINTQTNTIFFTFLLQYS